jgi:hypothetical protein
MAEAEGATSGLDAGFTRESSPPLAAEPRSGQPGQAERPDTALNRVLHGGGGRPDRAANRRTLTAELLIVMAVFPLPSAIVAIGVLIARIQLGYPLPWGSVVDWTVRGPWLWAALNMSEEFSGLAGAALVCYLLAQSGERLTAIGLGGHKLRMDLALVLPVFIVVQYLPQTFGGHLLGWLHVQGFYLTFPPQIQSHPALAAAQVVAGVSAGILEEIVVLGFLVRRLEQLGLHSSWVVIIAVLVRVSYHLYYGWNAVPIAMWALVSVLVYLRIRRLLPFILCHIAWDVGIALRYFYSSAYHVLLIAAIVASVVLTLWWGRRPAGSTGLLTPGRT